MVILMGGRCDKFAQTLKYYLFWEVTIFIFICSFIAYIDISNVKRIWIYNNELHKNDENRQLNSPN